MGSVRQSLRGRLLRHYGNLCGYCGVAFGKGQQKATIEHIIPRAQGGSNLLPNLMLTCYRCNHAKGNLTGREFLDSLGLYNVPTRRGHRVGEPFPASAYGKTCHACFDDYLTHDPNQRVCGDYCRSRLDKHRRGAGASSPIFDQLIKEYGFEYSYSNSRRFRIG